MGLAVAAVCDRREPRLRDAATFESIAARVQPADIEACLL
jgi:hypothetical protein